jgi:biopolymer transport protein ExbD
MNFTTRKRRQTPTVIIVSLIDVLIVVLIFLMVSTTFKKQPALKLSLATSSQAKPGGKAGTEPVIITVPKSGPLYLGMDPVTFQALTNHLKQTVSANPNATVAIHVDTDAPFGLVIKVRDAIKEAGFEDQNVTVPVEPAKPH